MQKIATALIVLIFILAGYLFWSSGLTTTPSDTPAAVDSTTASAARAHIAELTEQSGEQAIPVHAADNFVTADQLLALPQQGETLTLDTEQAANGAANSFGVELPASANAAEGAATPLALNRIRLQELLDDPEGGNRIFYIHGVNSEDSQGLWGIMQHGLTRTFADGIKVDSQSRTLSVQIPQDADERLQDRSSSFLGNLLNNKVKETLVYNYQEGLLGEDPNLIKPGQQLIIIGFSEDELIRIYNHFSHP